MRILALAVAALIGSAAPLAAQSLPPVRALGPVTNVSPSGVLGSVSSVRPLSTGGVIVNDITQRQLVLLDAQLRRVKVIADSAASGAAYGSTMGGLLAFTGDSSLFVDPQSLSMLVIDGSGEIARVMALPSSRDAMFMVGGPFGAPGLDGRGRIVYRGMSRPSRPPGSSPSAVDSSRLRPFVDSAPVFRFDLATRVRDTLAYITIPKQSRMQVLDKNGRMSGAAVLTNPMPVVDDWALLPDGRVAVVRGGDFHVDWLELDGHWVATAKIPYNWERLDDDTKTRVLDSLRTENEKTREALQKAVDANPPLANGMEGVTFITRNLGGETGSMTTVAKLPVTNFIDGNRIADYRPAFRMGAVRADAAGNLWVRTTAPSDAGVIYDVIDGKGVLVDRVKVPFGRVIAGFGAGVVYMGVLDDKGARLEKARIK
jgi:hypothetical protein